MPQFTPRPQVIDRASAHPVSRSVFKLKPSLRASGRGCNISALGLPTPGGESRQLTTQRCAGPRARLCPFLLILRLVLLGFSSLGAATGRGSGNDALCLIKVLRDDPIVGMAVPRSHLGSMIFKVP